MIHYVNINSIKIVFVLFVPGAAWGIRFIFNVNISGVN